MHRDAGIKKTVAESQLHEHQNSREADAGQSNSQANRLAHQHQRRQWNPTTAQPATDHDDPNRAITFRPESLETR